MPFAGSEQNAAYIAPRAVGPVMQCTPILPNGLPTAAPIVASGTYASGTIVSDGYKVIGIGLQSSQAGVLSIQRYLDLAGLVPQGAPSTQALTAATAADLNIYDGLPFASFSFTITNGNGGATAAITNFACLLNAA